MKKIRQIVTIKNALILSCVLLLGCIAGLIAVTPSVHPKTSPAETQTISVLSHKTEYYPGSSDTAFLLLSPENSSAHLPLLYELLAQGYPVQISYFDLKQGFVSAAQSDFVESESALLAERCGVQPQDQIWIGMHDGAGALLDQVVLGTVQSKAAVCLSPTFDPELIDDAIIVNGNYQNQSEWVNSLSPDMVRQPLLLLTSNGDDIATPYQMTLLYNKLSGDEIIHVGGVYHANKSGAFLSIIDGNFHPLTPMFPQTIQEIRTFLNQTLGENLLSTSMIPQLRCLLVLAACALLLIAVTLAALLAPQYAPQVSYGLPGALELKKKGRMFTALGLAWLIALLVSPLLWLLTSKMDYQLCYLLALLFLRLELLFVLFAKIFSVPFPSGFQAVNSTRRNILSAILLNLAVALPLCAILYAGYSSMKTPLSLPLLILLAAAWALVTKRMLAIDELLRQEQPPYARIGFYLLLVLPLLVLLLIAAVFLGSTMVLRCLVQLGLIVLYYLVGRALLSFCGQSQWSVTITAFAFALFSSFFYF